MNHLNRIRCTVLMLLLTANLRAEVFVVTSNADSGPGTLRAALQHAADNGDTETDHIHFNLPGSGTDARTIRLLTRLPDVNSSLVIDGGATQPGDALSINGAKIILTADMPEMDEETGYLYDQGAFWLKGSFQQFELYGMVIKGFRSLSEEGYYNDGQAIRVDAHIQTMVMGARGKGNVFYNNALTINVSVWEAASIHRMEMKNNFIGIDEAGHRIDGHLQSEVRLS